MNGSTAIFDFEKILENERSNYNNLKEKEILEKIDFLEKNKVEQSLLGFFDRNVFTAFSAIIFLLFLTCSFSLMVGRLTNLLFHSVGATGVSLLLGLFSGAFLSVSLFEKIKIKAKDKREIKRLKKLSKKMNSEPNFSDESFLSSTASPELIVAFEKEMGRQYLIEMYVSNNGEELNNQCLVDHFNKRDELAQEETNLRILYEDCIKKVEDKHSLCMR